MWAGNTGAGLSKEEMGMNIKKKLETMCPCYEWMDQIFGSKPNVQALNELNTTSQGEIIVVSDSDDKSDLEGVTVGDSGLLAYEKHQLQFKRAPKKKGTHYNDR
ncbi:hypothetical protein O181_019090 [Austropuccinia psidii MF-1]|uniref:Uncharacterized protein n=1 Tax=Austropuccinia psidii MF-1 TaxID=1389203 RepID=A0A9Q3C9X6_9BASI|nr:hypothetical protein [Austropuccinia psidii MF-1]